MPYYVSHPTAKVAHDGRTFSFGEELTNIEKLAEGELQNLIDGGFVAEKQPENVPAAQGSLNPSYLRPESGYADPQTPGDLPQSDPFAESLANNHDEIEAEDEARQQTNEPQNFVPTTPPADPNAGQVQQPQIDPATGQPVVAQPQVDPATGQPVVAQPQNPGSEI